MNEEEFYKKKLKSPKHNARHELNTTASTSHHGPEVSHTTASKKKGAEKS